MSIYEKIPVKSLLFTVPTEHKNRSMPYKERLPGGFHNWNLSSW